MDSIIFIHSIYTLHIWQLHLCQMLDQAEFLSSWFAQRCRELYSSKLLFLTFTAKHKFKSFFKVHHSYFSKLRHFVEEFVTIQVRVSYFDTFPSEKVVRNIKLCFYIFRTEQLSCKDNLLPLNRLFISNEPQLKGLLKPSYSKDDNGLELVEITTYQICRSTSFNSTFPLWEYSSCMKSLFQGCLLHQ